MNGMTLCMYDEYDCDLDTKTLLNALPTFLEEGVLKNTICLVWSGEGHAEVKLGLPSILIDRLLEGFSPEQAVDQSWLDLVRQLLPETVAGRRVSIDSGHADGVGRMAYMVSRGEPLAPEGKHGEGEGPGHSHDDASVRRIQHGGCA